MKSGLFVSIFMNLSLQKKNLKLPMMNKHMKNISFIQKCIRGIILQKKKIPMT